MYKCKNVIFILILIEENMKNFPFKLNGKKVNKSNLFALVAQQQHRQQKQKIKTRPNRLTGRTNSLTTRANCPATRAKCLTTRANSYNKSKQSRDWLVRFDITLTFVF